MRLQHSPLHRRDAEPKGNAATVISVVYVTAAPTFEGPIAGFSTIGVEAATPSQAIPVQPTDLSQGNSSPSPTQAQPQQQQPSAAATNSPNANSPSQQPSSTASVAVASSANAPSSTQPTLPPTSSSSNSPSAAAVSPASAAGTGASSAAGTGSASAADATSSPTATAQDNGLSGAAKAGIGIGVVLAVVLVALAAFFLWRRRKAQRQDDLFNNEKNPFSDRASAMAPVPLSSTTPPSQRTAPGSAGGLTGAGAAMRTRDAEKPSSSSSNNPFGAHAEIPSHEGNASRPGTAPSTRRAEDAALAAGAGAAVGGAAAAAAAHHAGKRRGPQPLDLHNGAPQPPFAQPSPAASQFSAQSMTSSMAAGAGANGAPTNVHRVQLDFKPSMDDEMELRAGQLVKLLHEYDDGWALCIRLDRSQQGVVPRTCLSTRPVKPRTGPPRGAMPAPGGRPGPPPSNTAAGRPQSPFGAAPPAKRSISPGPYGGGPPSPMSPVPNVNGRPRSNSMGDTRRPGPGPTPLKTSYGQVPSVVSSSGSVPPSPVARKPVPGRAV